MKTTGTSKPTTKKPAAQTTQDEQAQYVAFPIEQLECVIKRLGFAFERIVNGGDSSLVTVGCNIGIAAETVSEISRAIRKAKSVFKPNPRDNPHGVVMIRDMAPIL